MSFSFGILYFPNIFFFKTACYDLIQALNDCHQKEFLKRALGICNVEKEALSKCLHEARIEGTKHAIHVNREKRKKLDEKFKKIQEEQYGEDLYLKKLLHKKIAERDAALAAKETKN